MHWGYKKIISSNQCSCADKILLRDTYTLAEAACCCISYCHLGKAIFFVGRKKKTLSASTCVMSARGPPEIALAGGVR